MAYNLEEQEQIDELKAWWKQYGKTVSSLVIGLVVAYAAYQIWNYVQHKQAIEASTQYQELTVTDQKDLKAIQAKSDVYKRQNMGMLFITHDFGVVADIADNVVVMFRGEIVESGAKEAVLNNPQHPYTQALLACVPDAEGKKPLKPIDYSWLGHAA